MDTETNNNSGQQGDTENSGNTTPSTTKIQANDEKLFTQEEINDIIAKQKGNIVRKVQKQYEDLGSIDELKALKEKAEKERQQKLLEKGQFEEALKDLASKKDEAISKRDAIIKSYKINTPIIDSAAKHRCINPEQVQELLKGSLKLDDNGEVEVIDEQGKVRYNDNGTKLTVDQRVSEFLDSNPHFVQPTKSTTNTNSNISVSTNDLDITSLDMKNPKHRALYSKYRKERGLAQ